MAHDEDAPACAHTEQKEAFFADRMIRSGNQSGEIIQKRRPGFLESHTVFASVLRIFA